MHFVAIARMNIETLCRLASSSSAEWSHCSIVSSGEIVVVVFVLLAEIPPSLHGLVARPPRRLRTFALRRPITIERAANHRPPVDGASCRRLHPRSGEGLLDGHRLDYARYTRFGESVRSRVVAVFYAAIG